MSVCPATNRLIPSHIKFEVERAHTCVSLSGMNRILPSHIKLSARTRAYRYRVCLIGKHAACERKIPCTQRENKHALALCRPGTRPGQNVLWTEGGKTCHHQLTQGARTATSERSPHPRAEPKRTATTRALKRVRAAPALPDGSSEGGRSTASLRLPVNFVNCSAHRPVGGLAVYRRSQGRIASGG